MARGMDMKKRGNKIIQNKRAVSPWISWVLLVAFAIMLSAFMYDFMVSYTEDSTEDMKKTVYNTDECRLVSINIDSACMSTSILNITLQNKNYVRVDQLDFRVYNGRIPLHTNQTEIPMNPNRNKIIELETGVTTVTFVEVIPHIEKDKMDIICADKKTSSAVSASCT